MHAKENLPRYIAIPRFKGGFRVLVLIIPILVKLSKYRDSLTSYDVNHSIIVTLSQFYKQNNRKTSSKNFSIQT